jgi:hypothetical protein
MKTAIIAFLFLGACSPRDIKMIDDVIEGEAHVIEEIINDEAGCPSPKPQVTLIGK